MNTLHNIARALCFIFLLSPLAMQSAAAEDVTHDGLVEVESDKVERLFVKPGATLEAYNRIALLDCYVAFRKNWQRDQASSVHRVSKKDMDRIKEKVAEEFRTVFVDELQAKGGYELTDTGGEDVLILRPAIIDLDVTSPDLNTAGRSREFSASAGAMTLYLELHDGLTGEIIARIADRRAARDTGYMQFRNSITNKRDADRLLRKWASLLREALDHAHTQIKQPEDSDV